jgi:hypothetical protein
VDVAVVRMLVGCRKPAQRLTGLLFELPHHAACPGLQIKPPVQVLMLGMRRKMSVQCSGLWEPCMLTDTGG